MIAAPPDRPCYGGGAIVAGAASAATASVVTPASGTPASAWRFDGFGITTWICSVRLGGGVYEHIPSVTLIAPISSMPPVTGNQYRRCLRENGAARSFDTSTVYHAHSAMRGGV